MGRAYNDQRDEAQGEEQRGLFVAALDEAAFLDITNARLAVEEAAPLSRPAARQALTIASAVSRSSAFTMPLPAS